MTIFESILINFIFIVFPFFSYFLFSIYQRSCGKKLDNIFFDLAIYTALYLIMRYDTSFISIKISLIIIPLLIAYLKDKVITAIFSSLIISCYYYTILNGHLSVILLEFLLYLLVYLFLKNKAKWDVSLIIIFSFLKIFFLIFFLSYLEHISMPFIYSLLLILVYFLISNFIYLLLKKCEQITYLHIAVKELEKEKQLRDSLFKITHEIKNPIAVCKGYLDMFDINNKKHIDNYIPIIKQEIERTLTLMSDFLSLTKLRVEKEKIDVSLLLDDICDISLTLIKSHNMTFKTVMFDEEVYLLGDYNRLKQVFINIVKNAIEAIKVQKYGIIKLEVKLEKKQVKIYVIDNGIGMDNEILHRLGEPFFSTKKNGTGLGVRFSKEIIESHNGTLSYKSKKGKGTTAVISLPLL